MSDKIRKSARGEDCSLRLGMCSSPETVILAHIGRNRGMGIKCSDSLRCIRLLELSRYN